MVWSLIGGKPLFEAMMAYVTDDYMGHSAPISWNVLISVLFLTRMIFRFIPEVKMQDKGIL